MLRTLTVPAAGIPALASSAFRAATPESNRSVRRISLASRKTCTASVRAFAETEPAPASRRPTSLYEILRIDEDASAMEIKTAYRSLAKLYHPDSLRQSESDDRDFIQIHNAYATLSDPSSRALYDLSLAADRRRSFGYSVVGNVSRFYTSRRWETDQCW